jgi:hypothetical protein
VAAKPPKETPKAPEPAPTASNPLIDPPVAPASTAGHFGGVQVGRSEDATGAVQTTPGPGWQEETGKVAGSVKRVEWTPSQRGQVIPGGEIVCYTDRHKIIRVTNLPPEEALPKGQVEVARRFRTRPFGRA